MVLLSSCRSFDPGLIPYAAQQGLQQGSILLRAQKIETILKDPALEIDTQKKLQRAQNVLHFASQEMGMTPHNNYQTYVHLERSWLVQVLSAAQPDSLTPYEFDYPFLGKLPYKGFFDENQAKHLEQTLQAQGLDTYRRGTEAFSSLGWFPDPLLSTMMTHEGHMIITLLHELTHATFYFSDLADFNEAFATWMGYKASQQYIVWAQKSTSPLRLEIIQEIQSDFEFAWKLGKLIPEILQAGQSIYKNGYTPEIKKSFLNHVTQQFDTLYGHSTGVWNHARILALGTYYEWLPKIESYSIKEHLGPSDFLKKVLTEGPGILKKITTTP